MISILLGGCLKGLNVLIEICRKIFQKSSLLLFIWSVVWWGGERNISWKIIGWGRKLFVLCFVCIICCGLGALIPFPSSFVALFPIGKQWTDRTVKVLHHPIVNLLWKAASQTKNVKQKGPTLACKLTVEEKVVKSFIIFPAHAANRWGERRPLFFEVYREYLNFCRQGTC